MNMFLTVDLVDLPFFTCVPLYETSLNFTIYSTTLSQPREIYHRATYPGNAHLQVISLEM